MRVAELAITISCEESLFNHPACSGWRAGENKWIKQIDTQKHNYGQTKLDIQEEMANHGNIRNSPFEISKKYRQLGHCQADMRGWEGIQI